MLRMENTSNVSPGTVSQHGRSCSTVTRISPVNMGVPAHAWSCAKCWPAFSSNHWWTWNFTNKHKTFTLSPSISFIMRNTLYYLFWQEDMVKNKPDRNTGQKIHKILTLAWEYAQVWYMARNVTKFSTNWWRQLMCGMTLQEFTSSNVNCISNTKETKKWRCCVFVTIASTALWLTRYSERQLSTSFSHI